MVAESLDPWDGYPEAKVAPDGTELLQLRALCRWRARHDAMTLAKLTGHSRGCRPCRQRGDIPSGREVQFCLHCGADTVEAERHDEWMGSDLARVSLMALHSAFVMAAERHDEYHLDPTPEASETYDKACEEYAERKSTAIALCSRHGWSLVI